MVYESFSKGVHVKFISLLLLGLSLSLFAVDPKDIAEFELSCVRTAHDGPTQMIHAKISFEAAGGTCTAREGAHHQFNNGYDIAFRCDKPNFLFSDSQSLIYSWNLSSEPTENAHNVYQLSLVVDHMNLLASGFAFAPSGVSFPVYCKKW